MATKQIEISYCVVNTEQRALLERALDSIAAEREGLPFDTEVLVLDNGSNDGSVGVARRHKVVDHLIALDKRRGKGENDTALLKRAKGKYALLLNEDSELRPGATLALHGALDSRPGAGAAGAKLLRPDGVAQPSAWRFPTPGTALAAALFLHKLITVQSRGSKVRQVDWAQSAALMVRTDVAKTIDYFDPLFFVYSDEVDFCKRMRDAGFPTLYVPQAEVVHHEQLSTGTVPERRIVELSRNRDRYMRKHHTAAAAQMVRWLTAWTYFVRAIIAVGLPGHEPKRYFKHVTATLRPSRGEGLREAAYEHNRGRRL